MTKTKGKPMRYVRLVVSRGHSSKLESYEGLKNFFFSKNEKLSQQDVKRNRNKDYVNSKSEVLWEISTLV